VLEIAKDHDLVIMHTSTPSLPNDVECARRLKEQNPNVKIGFIGAHVQGTVRALGSLDRVRSCVWCECHSNDENAANA
jgi:hypothetical protein